MCLPRTREECTKQTRPETRQVCEDVTEKACEPVEEIKCEEVPTKQCEEKTSERTEQKCGTKPEKVCKQVPKTVVRPENVLRPVEECKDVDDTECMLMKVWTNVPKNSTECDTFVESVCRVVDEEVEVEQCEEEGRPCRTDTDAPYSGNTGCRQKYATYKLYAISGNNTSCLLVAKTFARQIYF